LAMLLCTGCVTEPAGVAPPIPPQIVAIEVSRNPENVLSGIVSLRARYADSVRVRFHLAADVAATDSVTPAVSLRGDAVAIPVLGLLPEERYVLHAVAYGAGGTQLSSSVELTTLSLPSDLPAYVASGESPYPGYVVFGAGKYGLVIDNSGRVVWYRRFADGPG